MFRPLWAIFRLQKYISGENIQYKNISCCANSELSTRSRCPVVIYIETNNMDGWMELKSIHPNPQFNQEVEQNNTFNYLDITIHKTPMNIKISISYRLIRHHSQHVNILYSLSTLPDEYIISFNIDNRWKMRSR